MYTSLKTLALLSVLQAITTLNLPRDGDVAGPPDTTVPHGSAKTQSKNLEITNFGTNRTALGDAIIKLSPEFTFTIRDSSSSVKQGTCTFPATDNSNEKLPFDLGVPQPCEPSTYSYQVDAFNIITFELTATFAHT